MIEKSESPLRSGVTTKLARAAVPHAVAANRGADRRLAGCSDAHDRVSSFRKRGLPRSDAKVGSMRNQPGER